MMMSVDRSPMFVATAATAAAWLLLALLCCSSWTVVNGFVTPTCRHHRSASSSSFRSSTTNLYALEDLTSKVMDLTASSGDTAVSAMGSVGGSFDPTILGVAGVAVLAVAGAVAMAASAAKSGGGNGDNTASKTTAKVEPEPEPIDVSIPYDAAALLAYQTVNPKATVKDADFQAFNAKYKQLTVAQVSLKNKQRQVLAMQEEFQAAYPDATAIGVNGVNGSATPAEKVPVEA
jgi:hypothetical protein